MKNVFRLSWNVIGVRRRNCYVSCQLLSSSTYVQNMSFHVLDKICKFCGVVVAVAKTRHSRELYIWERKRVRVLSAGGLVHCFRPCLRAHLICSLSLKKASFARIILVFHVFSWKKSIRVTAAMKLYMDETLEEDVCMVFDELEVQNSPL